jgi:hypothetical protein
MQANVMNAALLVQNKRGLEEDIQNYAAQLSSKLNLHRQSTKSDSESTSESASEAEGMFDGTRVDSPRESSLEPYSPTFPSTRSPSGEAINMDVIRPDPILGATETERDADDMEIDLLILETSGLDKINDAERDGRSKSASSEPPPIEKILTRRIRNTYIPEHMKNWESGKIATARAAAIATLRTKIADMQKNGVPNDEPWVPMPNAGEILVQLYQDEARLETEDASDALECVRELIQGLEAALDQNNERTSYSS